MTDVATFARANGINLRYKPHLKVSPLGGKILRHLAARGMTKQEFVNSAGISRITLENVIRGSRKLCQIRTVAGIQKALEEK